MRSSDNRVQRGQESRGLWAKALIAAEFEHCCQLFSQLSDALRANQPGAEKLEHLTQDYEFRLKRWGRESGASSRALDYALKWSTGLMRQVLYLLEDLHSILEQAITAVRPKILADAGASALPELQVVLEHKDDEDEAEGDEGDTGFDPRTCLDEAIDATECLFALLPVLQDPFVEVAPCSSSVECLDAHSIQAYKELATKMFPEAPATLTDRLSETAWQSRHRLLHLTQRAAGDQGVAKSGRPLSRGLRPGMRLRERPELPWRPRLHAESSMQQGTARGNSDAGSSTIRSRADQSRSESHYPDPSSTTSFLESQPLSIVEQIFARLALPETPYTDRESGNIHCPYCLFELPLSMTDGTMHQGDWARHVYLDLQPYLCTFGECHRENRPFGTKESWFQHEIDFHRLQMVWFCGMCRTYSDTAEDFRSHLQDQHQDLPHDSLCEFVASCKRYSTKELLPTQPCMLCGETLAGMDALKNHLAQHLETFALAVTLDFGPAEASSSEAHDRIAEFVEEQSMLHGPSQEPLFPGGQPTMPQLNPNSDTGALVGSSEASSADGLNTTGGGHKDAEYLQHRVKTFVDKQSRQSQLKLPPRILPRRCATFVGREHTFSRMHTILSNPGQLCILSGRGGVGKTSAALEYIYLHEALYTHAFWVHAENPAVCAENYQRIASALYDSEDLLPDEGSRAFFVKDCLERMEGRWLLVFDNVTSWGDVAQYIPRGFTKSRGSILVTTREDPLSKVPWWCRQRNVKLDVLSPDHGREFLLALLQSRLSKQDLESRELHGEAAEVVGLAQCLPLAIVMIAGYVKASGCTIADFIDMWDERETRKRNRKKRLGLEDTDIADPIHSLWEIGIREVPVNCRRLLNVISFLDPDCIQKKLLVGDHEEEYLEFLNAAETKSYRRMIDRLSGRHLLNVHDSETGEPIYSIHRTLQQKIQLDMEEYDFADAFRIAFRLIQKRFPQAAPTQIPLPESWGACKMYMPHVYSLHRIVTDAPLATHFLEPRLIDIAKLFYDAAFYIWSRQISQYNGLSLLITAENILNKLQAAPNHRLRADIHCIAGLLLLRMGAAERMGALERLELALNLRAAIWNEQPTHENDVMHQNAAGDYSLALLDRHYFSKAEAYILECYERYQVWGSETELPFEYCKYWGNYTVVLLWKGRLREAILYAEHCIELTEKSIGRSSQYWRRQFMLGCCLLQAGDLQGALDKHLETLAGRVEVDGQHHESTILSMYAVGAMYHHLGDTDKAIQSMEQCLESVKTAKWTVEGRGRAYYHLAELYDEKGIEAVRSQKLREDAMKILHDNRRYAGECVRASEDCMMIFDDMQPTFQGRYTGRRLLEHLRQTPPHRWESQ